jgi:hypothetical protein
MTKKIRRQPLLLHYFMDECDDDDDEKVLRVKFTDDA